MKLNLIAALVSFAVSGMYATPKGGGATADKAAPQAEPQSTAQQPAADADRPKMTDTPKRKISVKEVYGAISGELVQKVLADKGAATPLIEVYGIASRMKPGASEFGPFVRFVGQFRAKNLETGETFRSAALLLPKFLEEELSGAMDAGGGSAEFAMRLSIVASAKFLKDGKGTAYEYIADNLVPPRESDAMAALERAIAAAPAPALIAAPK